MKKGLHPANYRYVVFKDMSNGYSFLSRSTAATKETVKWEDGNEYPLVKLEISNTSHPFFTGKNVLVDTADVSINSKENTKRRNNILMFYVMILSFPEKREGFFIFI